MYKSPITGTSNTVVLYKQPALPLFQNMVFDTEQEAIRTAKREVHLVQCQDTGFVFNGLFDINDLDYNANYQNEQANSTFFQDHLTNVLSLLKDRSLLDGKIIEIGCGKGYFLNMMLDDHLDVIGIDPTYEGDSDKVIKEYYSKEHSFLNANLIVLRHTLEHIPQPFHFLQMIAEANNFNGKIYIEVPSFEWIMENNAVEDVFYEHCNYFTTATMAALFDHSEIIRVFNGQYLGVIADLKDVKRSIEPLLNLETHAIRFNDKLSLYRNNINNFDSSIVWGAGAKGSTFLNLLDANKSKIKAVIDINVKKQHKFVGGTGHPIVSEKYLVDHLVENIFVMNRNYLGEIETYIKSLDQNINLISL